MSELKQKNNFYFSQGESAAIFGDHVLSNLFLEEWLRVAAYTYMHAAVMLIRLSIDIVFYWRLQYTFRYVISYLHIILLF